jgi:hypothetical protein
VRSPKYDPRRYHRSGTLNKTIIGGLLLFAVVIFLALIIRGVFWQTARGSRRVVGAESAPTGSIGLGKTGIYRDEG